MARVFIPVDGNATFSGGRPGFGSSKTIPDFPVDGHVA